ncbi:RING finger, partial [Brachionus plicatilis]
DKLKKATLKALAKMEVRKISNGDKEITETCAICLENYQENDQIRELPCGHYFHQKDVDLWLLEHRNCPMCKINIIQACGIELQGSQNFYQKLIRIRRIFRNSAVEAVNETEASRASADISLESVSVSTNANNFQISHNDPELNINETTDDNINVSKSPNLQAPMLNSTTSNNHQGEKDITHSNRTNKIDV